MLKEFKEFAMKGNVLDLAIGVVIGAAFGKIVDSMVKDIISPIIGAATKGVDLAAKKYSIGEATFTYGNFITAAINFVIVAFVLFLIVKAANKFKKPVEEAPAETPADIVLLTEIRDLLQSKS